MIDLSNVKQKVDILHTIRPRIYQQVYKNKIEKLDVVMTQEIKYHYVLMIREAAIKQELKTNIEKMMITINQLFSPGGWNILRPLVGIDINNQYLSRYIFY